MNETGECHDRHARELDFYAHPAVDDDAITARREKRESAIRILLRWLVVAQFAGAVVLVVIILATRGCP